MDRCWVLQAVEHEAQDALKGPQDGPDKPPPQPQ